MARSLNQTYNSSLEKIALDRDLSYFLATSRNVHTRDIAWRLQRCADDVNIWFVNDPERGWLHGRFWKCGSKLCSFCLSAESRRKRKALLDAIDRLPKKLRKWHFVTFTIENPASTIGTTRQIVNDAWAKLRKRAMFSEVRAVAKSEEFTVTKEGFHYHIHTLIDCKWIDYQLWRKAWTECVESSGGESRYLFGFQTVDGMLIVNVKPVRNPKDIVNELGKYITKSTCFRDLSRPTLNELAEVKRWHRMFELLGDLRNKQPRERVARQRSSIVHTKSLSDGQYSDRRHFEEKREQTRFFMHDVLSRSFSSHVYSLAEAARLRSDHAASEGS